MPAAQPSIRAPEPATFYRMHGCLTGAYDIEHLKVRNRVVLTNKTPAGLVRGFGGPQVYFALERLVQRIATQLGLDPLNVYRRNFIRTFPYRAAAGALIDSGSGNLECQLQRGAAIRRWSIGFSQARPGQGQGVVAHSIFDPAWRELS